MQIINFFNPISKSRWHNPKVKHYVLIILCFLTTISASAIFFMNQLAIYICKTQERNSLLSQFDAKKQIIQIHSSLETNYTKIQETIKQLQFKNHALSAVLLHISKIIPNDVRITECTFEKKFTIIGYTKKLSKLYAFLQALANHPTVEKVNLEKTVQETIDQQSLIKFFCTIIPAQKA